MKKILEFQNHPTLVFMVWHQLAIHVSRLW
jgi:hypothetical protein